MSSLKDAITWSGPAVVILFTLGRVETPLDGAEFEISGVRPQEIERFEMSAEPQERRATVLEYDLTVAEESLDDPEFPGRLRECLRRAAAHAEGIAWLTFEGAFHFDHLFTSDIARQVYGYCVAGGEPVVVWDHETLESERWTREIGEVRSALDRDFPA